MRPPTLLCVNQVLMLTSFSCADTDLVTTLNVFTKFICLEPEDHFRKLMKLNEIQVREDVEFLVS